MAAAQVPTMIKPRPNPPPQREAGTAPARRSSNGRLPLAIRLAISVLILWHFTGIFLAALSIGPSSELVVKIAQRKMQWYLDALYLNQGHSFFAPEVGPGYVIRYELFDPSGRVIEQGELPNRKEHWPRLRYHRHFMLADQAIYPSLDQQYRDSWQRKYLEAYGRQLLRAHEDAQAVRVRRYVHLPIPRDLVLEGRKMTDPQSYEMIMEVTQQRSDLGEPAVEQNGMWQNGRQLSPVLQLTNDPWRSVTR
jgi:hypothetical protein